MVGAGPAGLACATTLAERGHAVDLFEAAGEIGGQFNMAKRIPGKEEFDETLRYFRRRIEITGVRLALGRRVAADELAAGGYDDVVLATGVTPRDPRIEGAAEFRAKGRCSPTSTCCCTVGRRASASRSSAPAASAST